MRSAYLFVFIILSICPAWGQQQLSKQLERLNFFPEASAYMDLGYEYQWLNIQTPQDSVLTKEVKNTFNILRVAYAQKFSENMFLGTRVFFEEASENGVNYGIPLRRRLNSAGFVEPEIFSTYRLRRQTPERGLVDFHASYSPKLGQREIGNQKATRLRGRSLLKAALSHGMWEDEWEFRTWLGLNYFGEGQERSKFSPSTFNLNSYLEGEFNFSTQYRLTPWLFIYGRIGIIYSGVETIKEENNDTREIKAGTGSWFELGLKKPINRWSLIELGYSIKRNEYFVKSLDANLEGERIQQQLQMNYKMAF
jgi:hypothetical protein